MTGPKLTALIVFGTLSFVFGALFSIGLSGIISAVVTGAFVAALVCALIWFAKTGRHAFARGFLGLGAVFIIVPLAALIDLGEQIANDALPILQDASALSDQEAAILAMSEFTVPSIVASAGIVFGMIVGLILVIIGGLMHLKKPQA